MRSQNGGRASVRGTQNSPLSIETLLNFLLEDLSTSLGLPLSANDASTLSRRLKLEGPVFAYQTLASLQESLLTVLEWDILPASAGFACAPGSKAPKFLGGLWKNVVDQDGRLLPDIERSPIAVKTVKAILQVAAAFSKYSDAAPWSKIPEYIEEFVSVDASLENLQFPRALISAAANVVTHVFDKFDLKEITPKHGPGAVATGERDEAKWNFTRVILSAHRAYPYYDYFIAGRRLMDIPDRIAKLKSFTKVETGTAKVLFVEKSATKLRTISMEPLELQFLQQGQMSKMVQQLQAHPLTRGHVNFDDQTVNQRQALVNSITRELATIDLSAASDRLSLDLVKALFINLDESVLYYLLATRSTHTKLPDGRLVELRKMAPMGSAVCFPVQSICFFALCVASIMLSGNLSMYDAAQSVYVFGDDIIIPSEYVRNVMDDLERVGLKVNRLKSFHRGFFRESCGTFAFAGEVVTPIRFKKSFPRSRGDGRGIAAWLAYAHNCEQQGYARTAEYIYSLIESIIGKLPYGLINCGYFCRLARTEYDAVVKNQTWPHYRWNEPLQRYEIKVWVLHTPLRDADFRSPFDVLLRDLITDFSESDPTKMADGRSVKPKAAWRPIL